MLVRSRLTRRPLDEAEAAQVLHLLEFEREDLAGRRIQPADFLLAESKALHELDVPQRLGRRSRQRGRLRDDHFLNLLDAPAQDGADDAEDRHGQEVNRRDQPVHRKRIDHHEDDPDERREQHVDRGRDQPFDVGADLLQPAQRLAAPLVFEDRIGQLQRMPDAVRVELCSEALRDDVDVVVLEVLGHTRHECDADGGAEQKADALEEFDRRIFLEPGRVLIDDMAEDQRIEQRERLVDRRQRERHGDEPPVAAQIGEQELHPVIIIRSMKRALSPRRRPRARAVVYRTGSRAPGAGRALGGDVGDRAAVVSRSVRRTRTGARRGRRSPAQASAPASPTSVVAPARPGGAGARRASAEVRDPAVAPRAEEPDGPHDPACEHRRFPRPRAPVQCARREHGHDRVSPHRDPCERGRDSAGLGSPADVQRTAGGKDICGSDADQRSGPTPGQAAGRHGGQPVLPGGDRRADEPHVRIAAGLRLERRGLHRPRPRSPTWLRRCSRTTGWPASM